MRLNRRFTALLWIVLILLVMGLWSLFVSGPSRVHEASEQQTIQTIEKNVKGINGITTHIFDYKTYQGYTKDRLYWFDVNGKKITSRKIKTLDYKKAKKTAKKNYGIEAKTIELGYGYNNPCYVIKSDVSIILIDYDTFERVYQGGIGGNE